MDLKPAPDIVSQRLKSQFAPAYLTLTSIIQGVALSVLAARVEATYTQFDATDWLVTSATFLAFVTLWHEYLMQSLAFVWIPTLLDALVPFAFLAGELFMAHFVYHGLRGWLLAFGLTFVVGGASVLLLLRQTRRLGEENRDLVSALRPHRRMRAVLSAVTIVASLGGWALYDVLRLGQAALIIALLAAVLILVFLGSTVPYWNGVLAYTRGEYQAQRSHPGKSKASGQGSGTM
jgi:hypothetical protein